MQVSSDRNTGEINHNSSHLDNLISFYKFVQVHLGRNKSELEHNLFYFKNDFIIDSQKLEEMLHEQSREAYQFLFRYYSNIEPNKKQATESNSVTNICLVSCIKGSLIGGYGVGLV